MDKDLREEKNFNIIDQFHERKIMSVKFYSIGLKDIYPFCYGNSRGVCIILIANDNEIIKFIDETKKVKCSKSTGTKNI